MENKVGKILLFTLTACPTGRSIGTVLNEVHDQYPEIEIEKVYVEIQTELTNQFRIKKNPTTLFLDSFGKEQYRFEGFKETDDVLKIMKDIETGKLGSTSLPENQESVEEYTIYLCKNQSAIPVKVEYRNLTSVKAPRITAINLLLQTHLEGYQNPFPKGTALELVQFKGDQGKITFKLSEEINEKRLEKLKSCLQKTLESFGITQVELFFN